MELGRILLADDEATFATSTAELLRKLGGTRGGKPVAAAPAVEEN